VTAKRAIVAERISAQGLSGPPLSGPAAVAERLLAVQAQDPRGARLAIRARTAGLAAGDVDRAFSEDRSILVTWLNRGTLHLVRREDYPLLQSLTTPPLLTANTRRLRQEGVSEAAAERGVATVERALADEGPLAGRQLKERLEAAGVRTAGQAFVHLMFLSALRGITVRGPMIGKQHAYALVHDWLGPQKSPGLAAGLAELARRYLAGHGPAGERDLARWAGLPLRDARAGLEAIASKLVARGDGLVDLAGQARDAELPPPPCLAPSSRCCWAGPRARRSSARTGCWSPTTASSAPLPWSAAAPRRPGASRAARSRSSLSARLPRGPPPRSKPRRARSRSSCLDDFSPR
jgi:DNA glycosylase AlkZ-like